MEVSLKDKIKTIFKLMKNKNQNENLNEIIKRLIDATQKNLLKALKPKLEVISLKENMLLSDALEIIKKYNYTKYPVLGEDGEFIGIFYLRDLLKNLEKINELTVRKLTKPAITIPYNYNILQALEFLRSKRVSMAFVINENGIIIGIITIEDLVEEIVGDIKGEYEILDIIKVSDDEYRISGGLSFDEFLNFIRENFNVDLEVEINASTIAGFVMDKLGKIPVVGDKITIGNFIIEVIETDGYRIKLLRLKRK